MKRQYKITLIIILALIIFIGGYFLLRSFLSSNTQPPVDTSEPDPSEESFPEVGDITGDENEEDQITTSTTDQESNSNVPVLISDEENQVFDFWIDSATRDAIYITTEGQIYNAKVGQDIQISNQSVSALNSIEISPSNEYILVAFGDPKNPNWGVFDNEDNVWRPLPSSIDNATWGSNDSLIVVLENETSRSLEQISTENGVLSDVDFGSNIIINDFRIRDIKMNNVSEDILVIAEKPSENYLSRAWEINLETGSINNVINDARGLMFKWTDSYVFKYDSSDKFFILNHNFENALPVFFDTLPSKCSEANSIVYCGVPRNSFFNNKNLPDSYLQESVFSVDVLYSVDSNTLTPESIFESGRGDIPPLDIKNPRYSNGDLYFINRYNKGLYKVSI